MASTNRLAWIFRGYSVKSISASEFNQRYEVGHTFVYQSNQTANGGPVVRTVGPARGFKKSGAVVEINKPPYFVKVSALIA
nr:hypothetical protein [Serratia marcescens]